MCRYELALGSSPFSTDLVSYISVHVNNEGVVFLGEFLLPNNAVFFATIRIFNNVGLHAEFSSEEVVVSQNPYLLVKDGYEHEDIDFQSTPSIVQGSWTYSAGCPITEAKWLVSSLAGDQLFDYTVIPNAGKHFYNDEVKLDNGMKYFVTVETYDFLGRVRKSQSDGVSVRIQPPYSAPVRDGFDHDINYQFSTSDLSANWDKFGDDSNDPTQKITRYEVAIGNDRRYSITRSNVHYFVNVGLNLSHTFFKLNLTERNVRYYITVRAYSEAGSFVEGFSNGVRVGFDDNIVKGDISVNSFQSDTDTMEISWGGFDTDIQIIDYKVAISSHENITNNDTVKCHILTHNTSIYDVRALKSVGLNEYVKIVNLTLVHGATYFVTVVAEDEAGMCIATVSEPVIVDTTPPTLGQIFINDIAESTVIYARKSSELNVQWHGFQDEESGIRSVIVKMFDCDVCINRTVSFDSCYLIDKSIIINDSKSAFYELSLSSQRVYYVLLEVYNGAKLVSIARSPSLLIDETAPIAGQVKITSDWTTVTTIQSSTSTLAGYLPIAMNLENHLCPSEKRYFPSNGGNSMGQILEGYSDDFLIINYTGAYMGIGYTSDLSHITKTGISSEKIPIMNGNYTFNIAAAIGFMTITTVGIVTNQVVIPYTIDDKPEESFFDITDFNNLNGLIPSNETLQSNITNTTSTSKTNIYTRKNMSDDTSINFDNDEYGFGIHFLGYKIGSNNDWHHIFWAISKYHTAISWFQVTKPPGEISSYTINVKTRDEFLTQTLDITLILDGEELVTMSGFKFYGDIHLVALTWMEDDYMAPLDDIYKPFYSDAVLRAIDIPDERDKLCRHGAGFYDEQSAIKELWLGVSDNVKEAGNIKPFSFYQSFCYPCMPPCTELCMIPCNGTVLTDGFNLIPIEQTGLSMDSLQMGHPCFNISNEESCNSTAYYLNVRLVNYAGLETIAFSNSIQIDITPPECFDVKCTDPDFNIYQPTDVLGSSSSIGGIWNCTDYESQIVENKVEIIHKVSGLIVMNSTSVGLNSSHTISLENGTFLDKNEYELKVTVLNNGGLSATGSCHVHVNLFPPDVSYVDTDTLYTDDNAISSPNDTCWSDSQTSIGIRWSNGTFDTEFYGKHMLFVLARCVF